MKRMDFVADTKFWEYSPGLRLAWNEYGASDGKPVFYYHGWPSSRLQAMLAHDVALQNGIRLIAMDRPGIGKSSFIPKRTLDDWPRLMERFADYLKIDSFGQIGVSGGGPYVLACAAVIPKRLHVSVVLAGMVPLPLTRQGSKDLHPLYRVLIPLRRLPSPCFTAAFRIASSASKFPVNRFPISFLLRSLAEADRRLLSSNPSLFDILGRSFREGVSSGGRGVMADAGIYLGKPEFAVETITHPIDYWHGGEDKNIPITLVRELTSKMPNARLHTDSELGHFSLAIHRAADAFRILAL